MNRLGAADYALAQRGFVQGAAKSRKVREPPSGEPVAAVVARGEAEIGLRVLASAEAAPAITKAGLAPAAAH